MSANYRNDMSLFLIPQLTMNSTIHCGPEDQRNLGRKQVGKLKKKKPNKQPSKPRAPDSPLKNPKQSTDSIALQLFCDRSQVGVEELRKP